MQDLQLFNWAGARRKYTSYNFNLCSQPEIFGFICLAVASSKGPVRPVVVERVVQHRRQFFRLQMQTRGTFNDVPVQCIAAVYY